METDGAVSVSIGCRRSWYGGVRVLAVLGHGHSRAGRRRRKLFGVSSVLERGEETTLGGPRLSKGGCEGSCARKCRVQPRLHSPYTSHIWMVMLKFTIDLWVGGDVVGCGSGDSKMKCELQGLSSFLGNTVMDGKLIEKLGMIQQVGGVMFTLHLDDLSTHELTWEIFVGLLVTRSWLLHFPHFLLSDYYSKWCWLLFVYLIFSAFIVMMLSFFIGFKRWSW